MFLHLFNEHACFPDKPKLVVSSLTAVRQVFFGCPICLVLHTLLYNACPSQYRIYKHNTLMIMSTYGLTVADQFKP